MDDESALQHEIESSEPTNSSSTVPQIGEDQIHCTQSLAMTS